MEKPAHPLAVWLAAHPETSKTALAAQLQVSRQYVHSLIAQDHAPSYPFAARLADATHGAVPVTAWHERWAAGKRGWRRGRKRTTGQYTAVV